MLEPFFSLILRRRGSGRGAHATRDEATHQAAPEPVVLTPGSYPCASVLIMSPSHPLSMASPRNSASSTSRASSPCDGIRTLHRVRGGGWWGTSGGTRKRLCGTTAKFTGSPPEKAATSRRWRSEKGSCRVTGVSRQPGLHERVRHGAPAGATLPAATTSRRRAPGSDSRQCWKP